MASSKLHMMLLNLSLTQWKSPRFEQLSLSRMGTSRHPPIHHCGAAQIQASLPLASLMVFLRPHSPSVSILWNFLPLAFQGFLVGLAVFNPFQYFQTLFLTLCLVQINNLPLLKRSNWGMLHKCEASHCIRRFRKLFAPLFLENRM